MMTAPVNNFGLGRAKYWSPFAAYKFPSRLLRSFAKCCPDDLASSRFLCKSNPQQATTTTSGSASSTSLQVTCLDRPSEVGSIASFVPIKRAISGIQCPPQKGGSIHSITSIRIVLFAAPLLSILRCFWMAVSNWNRFDRSSSHTSFPLRDIPAASATCCMFAMTSFRFIGVNKTTLASIPASFRALKTVAEDGAQTWHKSWVTINVGEAFFSNSLFIGYSVGISSLVNGHGALLSLSLSPEDCDCD
mmetsp:Transcript_23247/g.50841  ORF Transcript_23247/g.50841 Transcript_23247/m.50841 type:complete len:247 (+) Transcript_23247:170-910(+)